jgi:hypothetical protein
VLVSAGEAYGRLEVWVSNDKLESASGHLTLRVWSWSGERLRECVLPVTIPAQSSRKCWDTPLPEVFAEPCQHERFITLQFTGPGVDARNVYYPEPFRTTRVSAPQFQVSAVRETAQGLEFQVSADRPAPFVYLTAGGRPGRFSDNGFLLMPQEEKKVVFLPGEKMAPQALKAGLNLRGVA